jgi:hypothetical protein
VVAYPSRDGADPPPPHSFSLRSAWMEGRYVHITAEQWEEGQAVLAGQVRAVQVRASQLLLLHAAYHKALRCMQHLHAAAACHCKCAGAFTGGGTATATIEQLWAVNC